MDKIPMTAAGYTVLEEELKHRQQVERPRIIQQITDARTHGDLSENAEYHAAREQQGFIEGRIGELEAKLSTAEIIDPSRMAGTGKIVFGCSVELENQGDGGAVKYQIVGEDEANIRAGRVSITSPIARALVGKSEGDVVDVDAPGGVKSFEVVSVHYE
jgi:transcription elongation factor GreA